MVVEKDGVTYYEGEPDYPNYTNTAPFAPPPDPYGTGQSAPAVSSEDLARAVQGIKDSPKGVQQAAEDWVNEQYRKALEEKAGTPGSFETDPETGAKLRSYKPHLAGAFGIKGPGYEAHSTLQGRKEQAKAEKQYQDMAAMDLAQKRQARLNAKVQNDPVLLSLANYLMQQAGLSFGSAASLITGMQNFPAIQGMTPEEGQQFQDQILRELTSRMQPERNYADPFSIEPTTRATVDMMSGGPSALAREYAQYSLEAFRMGMNRQQAHEYASKKMTEATDDSIAGIVPDVFGNRANKITPTITPAEESRQMLGYGTPDLSQITYR